MKTLDIKDAAAFIKVHEQTARRLAKSGELPGAKPGKHWCFIEEDLVEYLRSKYVPQPINEMKNTKELKEWHSTKDQIPDIGGRASLPRMGDKYADLLKLPTGKPPRNSKTD